jgi:hypothetical protein
VSIARGSCSRRVYETVYLSVLFSRRRKTGKQGERKGQEPLLGGKRGRDWESGTGPVSTKWSAEARSPLAGAPGIWWPGQIDQGRYQSFPVESDEQFWVTARCVERNGPRAQLVVRAEEWQWSSLWRHGTSEERALLATWPTERPPDWVERVNRTDDERELESLRPSVHRGRPFVRQEWPKPIAKRSGLGSAYRPSC